MRLAEEQVRLAKEQAESEAAARSEAQRKLREATAQLQAEKGGCACACTRVWVFACALYVHVCACVTMHIIRTGSDKCSSENMEAESATHSPTKVPAIHRWEILAGDDMHG